MKKITIGFFAVGFLAIASAVSAQVGMMGGYGSDDAPAATSRFWGRMMGWPSMMGNYYGESGFFGWTTMILIWVLLVLGIAVAVKWLMKKEK